MCKLGDLRLYILVAAAMLVLIDVSAQKTIKGYVIDERIEPVAGANVSIKGMTIVSVTDTLGRFSIAIDSATLGRLDTTKIEVVVSYVGYDELVMEKTGNKELVCYLQASQLLNEVVVVGNSAPPHRTERKPKAKFAVVRIFYGTDRKSIEDHGEVTFSGEPDYRVTYGTCKVSVPVDRDAGEIPEPSFIKFDFIRNPDKHFRLLENVRLDKTEVMKRINERLAKSSGKNAFIFIHGYNVSFYNAALRTAQMARDLNFDGVPIFYSWPSKNTFYHYMTDEETIKVSELYIKNFISDVAAQTDAKNIYLIGHSMGTRALTNAIVSLLHENPGIKNKIREIILAAPDIQTPIFTRDIVPGIISSKCNLTLYASKNDIALKASKIFHSYSRAGQTGEGLVVVKGMETIDASDVGATDLFGHSYFADTEELLKDIQLIVKRGLRAAQRERLKQVLLAETPYWVFKFPVN